jgi:hypothetical protein
LIARAVRAGKRALCVLERESDLDGLLGQHFVDDAFVDPMPEAVDEVSLTFVLAIPIDLFVLIEI